MTLDLHLNFRLKTFFIRYYEKSIIEQAINHERSMMGKHWEETKKSIRDARYRLSLSTNSELGGESRRLKEVGRRELHSLGIEH